MREVKTANLVLDTYGNCLGMEKGCIILRDRHRKEKRYPLFEAEIGEIVLKSGNTVSTGVLSALGSGDSSAHGKARKSNDTNIFLRTCGVSL